MPGILLRHATGADAARMAEIDALVNPSPWSEDGFREGLRNNDAIVAGCGDGALDGFVLFRHVVEDAEILNIGVHPRAQRRGLGRLLLHAVLTEVARGGATHCFLEVRASNAPAQALYNACGFLESGTRRDYYRGADGREDALIFTCRLD